MKHNPYIFNRKLSLFISLICICLMWSNNVSAQDSNSGNARMKTKIEGVVKTSLGKPISKVSVVYTNSVGVETIYQTLEDGYYQFDIDINESGTLHAFRNDNLSNGVNTLDLVIVQKHLLGISSIQNPHALIAADVNNSVNVSAIDLIEMKKLILQISSIDPSKSWRIFDATFDFESMTGNSNLFTLDIDPTRTVYDFIGVKAGDLNFTVLGQ